MEPIRARLAGGSHGDGRARSATPVRREGPRGRAQVWLAGRGTFLAAVACCVWVAATTATASAQPATKLQVYTKPIEPFAFQRNGRAAGFSIELWDRVAREMDVRYELHWVQTVGEVIEAVRTRRADVGVAAISITAEREASIDFSTPFYESGLSILVNAQGRSAVSSILESVLTWDFLKLCGVLLGLLVVTAHLVWFFERKRNPEQFPEPYLQGVWESAWWAISTILSGGCDAKGPMVLGGRIVGAFWMLVCIIVITYFTAAITTIMTVNQLTSDISGPRDLPGLSVATVSGSTAERYLRSRRAKVRGFRTIDGAYAALNTKQVRAVVYDAPILMYHQSRSGNPQQMVVGRLFERQNYGIAMPANSPHRRAINQVLRLREEGFIDELNARWFGDES